MAFFVFTVIYIFTENGTIYIIYIHIHILIHDRYIYRYIYVNTAASNGNGNPGVPLKRNYIYFIYIHIHILIHDRYMYRYIYVNILPLQTETETQVFLLKGLSHEIFRPVFWSVWMHLGLNVNRLWFFNFKEGSLILYSYFNY